MKNVNYDVVVVGGGIAGVAAAVAAARRNRKVALIEKTVFLGGLATTGLVFIYLPICDGKGAQLARSLPQELLERSMKYGPGEIHKDWVAREPKNHDSGRYRCTFSPAAYMLALDEVLQEAGVDIWLDSLVCGVKMNGKCVTAVELENKSGRISIQADCFVDASGDCEILRRAGAPVHDCNNSLTMWAIEYLENCPTSPASYLGKNIRMQSNGTIPADETENEKTIPPDRLFRGIDGAKVSEFILRGRRELREHYRRIYKSGEQTRNTNFAMKLPAMAQFRKIFSIDGQYTLNDGDEGRFFADSIGVIGDWRCSGKVWEIPYRTLLPRNVDAVLAAGRCSAAVGDAWEITRVIPTAALTGEAAGVAAAMASEQHTVPAGIAYADVQNELRKLHIPLHIAETDSERLKNKD